MQLLGSLHRAPKPPAGLGTPERSSDDRPENVREAVLRAAASRWVREALEGEKKKRPLLVRDVRRRIEQL